MESREPSAKIEGYLSRISFSRFDSRVTHLTEFTSKLKQGMNYFDQQLQKETTKSFWEDSKVTDLTRALNYYPPAAYVNDKLWQHLQVETFKKAVDSKNLDQWYENLVRYTREFLFDKEGNFSQEARANLPQLDDILTGKIKFQDKNGSSIDINDAKALSAFKKEFFTAMLSGASLYQLQEPLQSQKLSSSLTVLKKNAFTEYEEALMTVQGKIANQRNQSRNVKPLPTKSTLNTLIRRQWKITLKTLQKAINNIEELLSKEASENNEKIFEQVKTILTLLMEHIRTHLQGDLISADKIQKLEENLKATKNSLNELAKKYEPRKSDRHFIFSAVGYGKSNPLKEIIDLTYDNIDLDRAIWKDVRQNFINNKSKEEKSETPLFNRK